MFYKHSILDVNGQETLYLYLDNTYEFAQDFYGENRKRTIYEKVNNYIRNQGIKFNGNKVYLVVNGIVVSALTIDPLVMNGKQNVDEMFPYYQFVEILTDLLPENKPMV